MRHIFLCPRGARRDVGQRACNRQQVLYPMTHLARQQLVRFFSLLALGDIQEDAEHDPISYVGIVALASGRNPSNVAAGQNSKINLIRATTALVVAKADLTRSRSAGWMFFERISKLIFVSLFGTSQSSYARSSMVMASVSTFQAHKATPAARVAPGGVFRATQAWSRHPVLSTLPATPSGRASYLQIRRCRATGAPAEVTALHRRSR